MHAEPGDEWVTQTAFLKNVSSEPIVIKSIELMPDASGAEGLTIKSIEMAPLPHNGSKTYNWTPGGVFKTYPPAVLFSGEHTCNIQDLVDVADFALEPGAESRVAVVMSATGTGPFGFSDYVVRYEQGGSELEQRLPFGLAVRIGEGTPLVATKIERPCFSDVDVLPSRN